MLAWISLGFILAALAPWITKLLKKWTGFCLALFPAGIFIYLLMQINSPSQVQSIPWMPTLGLDLAFRLDGLALLMALLVSGIGALVLVYGGGYLHGHAYLPRFYALIIFFMSAMLGVVTSDNGLLLFVFWELTSIASFLLIGFENDLEAARGAAWQALLITSSGGLAMLAGLVLLSQMTGTWSITGWLNSGAVVQASPLYPAVFWLILAGAATKSAQFPFHFWLPNAMAAPTPVSAYLHSATMVKAGVYLLARLLPVLGGTSLWQGVLPILGMLTLLATMLLLLAQHDLKRLLAYSTVGALGLMVTLIGLDSKVAVEALVVLLLAHGLYKGALFLIAGGVDHAAGTRDIRRLGNLASHMPFTTVAGTTAALSMAGVAPFLGFMAKELVYESGLTAIAMLWLMPGLVFTNAIMAASAGWVGWLPFLPRKQQTAPATPDSHSKSAHPPHENTLEFWLPALLLALLGLIFGIFPQLIMPLMEAAAQAVLQQSFSFKLSLWHGLNPALVLSLLTLAGGLVIYFSYEWIEPIFNSLFHRLRKFGPAEGYDHAIHHLKHLAAWQTRLLQSGYLRRYILIITMATIFLSALAFIFFSPGLLQTTARASEPLRSYDVVLAAIIIIASILAVRERSRLATIALLGAIGYSISLIYLLYSAPDLAMVQIAIETLTVILFILVIYRLPKFSRLTMPPRRAIDLLVAGLGGALMSALMLMVTSSPAPSDLAEYYIENAQKLANGRNVVNVILVDFRGLDTLGEISVLSIAALGVLALLGLNATPRLVPPSIGTGGKSAGIESGSQIDTSQIKRSIILPVAARYLMPLLLVFSIFLLLRGHNEAGGGFVGGLVAAAAFILYGIANSPQSALNLVPIQPRILIAIGLLVSTLSAVFPLFFGLPLMTGMWLPEPLAVIGKLGTPVIFDTGVYLTVIGVMLLILLSLAKEEQAK
jgi:multicomponent Na+:H+ antiporter subunit A